MPVPVVGIDHVYLTVASLERSESFYDRVLVDTLEFRKNRFELNQAPHVQYYNRHFGLVLRPARSGAPEHSPSSPGLHHLCLRVDSPADVSLVSAELNARGIAASEAGHYPEYAPDYFATFFEDPDGIRLEVTNFRQERRARMDQW